MEKIRLKDIDLSEEIKKHGKKVKKSFKNIKMPTEMFIAKIPYKEFEIVLVNIITLKGMENIYYSKSKYGWWTYCAKKERMDEVDKKILILPKEKSKVVEGEELTPTWYGMYRNGDHSFCNDNMWRKEDILGFDKVTQHHKIDFYNLHPNDMVKIVKKNIDKFYDDKEKLKGGDND